MSHYQLNYAAELLT